MKLKSLLREEKNKLKMILKFWFPWLDIPLLILSYFLFYGQYISPYQQYLLLTHGVSVKGIIHNESGVFAYSVSSKMRDFNYTFTLKNGETCHGQTHFFSLNGESDPSDYPMSTAITYLPNQPDINWLTAPLAENLFEFIGRVLLGGILLVVGSYAIIAIAIKHTIIKAKA